MKLQPFLQGCEIIKLQTRTQSTKAYLSVQVKSL